MTITTFFQKVRNNLWSKLVRNTRNTSFYPFIYRSYWHYLINRKINAINKTCYFAARPNPGAGIGHQMANWIAGYWWAKQFGLKFAHLPFSNQKWEDFLGFGENEEKVFELKKAGYKVRTLPLFAEERSNELLLNKKIISSYQGEKVVFIAEQDQGFKDQYGIMDDLKRKFNTAVTRKLDKLVYNPQNFNIAVHVRRTVIIDGVVILENEAIQALRWLQNDYYERVLIQTLQNLYVLKPISIYIFSTGKPEEFAEFAQYGDVHFCSDMDEYTTFLHLIRADLLISSKSSYSYKPALISEGYKICPRNFWHGYPDEKHWILAENDGTFDVTKLREIS